MTTEARQHHQTMRRILRDGYGARQRGESRESAPYGMILGELEKRSWWMAVWHEADQDMELLADSDDLAEAAFYGRQFANKLMKKRRELSERDCETLPGGES